MEAFLFFDVQRRILAASPGAAGVLSLSDSALVGLPCREAFDCPACSGEACPLRRALAGEVAEGFLPALRAGGAVAVTATPAMAAGGQVALVQLRQPEPEENVLGAGLRRVLDALRQETGSDLAAVAFYDQAAREVRWQLTSGSISTQVPGIRLRPGQGFAGRIILTDLPLKTFRFPDDLTDDPASYPIFEAEGLKAALGVPIRSGAGGGVLMVAQRAARVYTDEEETYLIRLADSFSLASEVMSLYGEAIRSERSRLAHEVHDSLSQNLFGLKLLLFDLQQQQGASPVVQKGLGQVCGLLDSTLMEVRRFIADMRRGSQVQAGVVSALADYLSHFYRLSGIHVEFAVQLAPDEEVTCPDRNELLRVVQEALMNVHRHAAASRVRVEIGYEDQFCRIAITDNGRGFDPSQVAEGHFGLATMRERAARLGGRLTITSHPGEATCVTLYVPV